LHVTASVKWGTWFDFLSCRALDAETIMEQLTPCRHLERVRSVYPGLEGDILAAISNSWGSIIPSTSNSGSNSRAVSNVSWGSINSGVF